MEKQRIEFNLDKVSNDECVPVQLQGRAVCEDCPHKGVLKGDEACSGQKILRTGKNAMGHEIPVTKKRF